jgi:APA family basic amino acid/polyamine antiporter
VELATLIKLASLLLFVVIGAMLIEPTNLPLPTPPLPHEFGRALLLAIFWCSGVYGAIGVGGEVRDPARTLPRAVILGMTSVTLLFVGVQVIAQGGLGPAVAGSATSLADTMARVSPALRLTTLIGVAIAMTGWLASDALNTPRLLFAFAPDGWLPAWLGRLDARSHAPVSAVMTHLATAAALALALGGSYKQLALVSPPAAGGDLPAELPCCGPLARATWRGRGRPRGCRG